MQSTMVGSIHKYFIGAITSYRENKNRYLMSYLSSLVRLQIFEEITVDYLLVGHTGNEVSPSKSMFILVFQ